MYDYSKFSSNDFWASKVVECLDLNGCPFHRDNVPSFLNSFRNEKW